MTINIVMSLLLRAKLIFLTSPFIKFCNLIANKNIIIQVIMDNVLLCYLENLNLKQLISLSEQENKNISRTLPDSETCKSMLKNFESFIFVIYL